MSVRAIAEMASTSTATVGRSRKRWEVRNDLAASQQPNDETPPETAAGQVQETFV